MNTETKRCENCKHYLSLDCEISPCDKMKRWKRNSNLWLSIVPEEPGWYWHKRCGEGSIMIVTKNDIESWKKDASWVKLFKWQGPITPKG